MFLWKDYIKVSKSLQKYSKINSTVTEGFLRSGVSRAYYAAYHAALNYAIGKGFNYWTYKRILRSRPGNKGESGPHAVLIQFLLDQPDLRVRSLGSELQRCKLKRTQCDYKDDIIVDDRFVNILYIQTDNIQTLIPTLP